MNLIDNLDKMWPQTTVLSLSFSSEIWLIHPVNPQQKATIPWTDSVTGQLPI